MRDELNLWKFGHLTVFGKLTVIKVLCIPKFTQIATVIPNLCLHKIEAPAVSDYALVVTLGLSL